ILLDSFRLAGAVARQSEEQIQRAVRLNLDYFNRYLDDDAPERAILAGKMGSYLRYLDTIGNEGAIRGDIHLIESNEFAGDARREAWAEATSEAFRKYRGHGPHVDMILEQYVERDAAVVREILEQKRG